MAAVMARNPPARLRREDTHDQHARRVGRPEVAPTPAQQAIQETTPRALGEAAPRTTQQTSLAPSEQGAEGETQPQVEILSEMAVAGERSPGRPGAAVWQRADPEQVAVPGQRLNKADKGQQGRIPGEYQPQPTQPSEAAGQSEHSLE